MQTAGAGQPAGGLCFMLVSGTARAWGGPARRGRPESSRAPAPQVPRAPHSSMRCAHRVLDPCISSQHACEWWPHGTDEEAEAQRHERSRPQLVRGRSGVETTAGSAAPPAGRRQGWGWPGPRGLPPRGQRAHATPTPSVAFGLRVSRVRMCNPSREEGGPGSGPRVHSEEILVLLRSH